jgi:hypothetical protein
VFLTILDEFVLTSVQVWENNSDFVERIQVVKLKSSLRTLYVHHHDFVNMHGISLTKITMDISLYYHSNDVLKVTVSTVGFLPRLDFPTEDIFINKRFRACAVQHTEAELS